MNDDYPIIYHIGLMKTGTTSIQNILKEDPTIDLILKSRYFNTNKYFTESYPTVIKNLISIESDEVLSRNDGFYGLEESLRRIHKVQPEAKIVITIREQRSLLLSAYKHHIRQTSDTYTFIGFLNSPAGYDYIKLLDYYFLFKSIERFFTADRIYFFLYEDLKNDFNKFISDFYIKLFGKNISLNFKNTHLNKGGTDDLILLRKKLNKYRAFNNKNFFGKIDDLVIKAIIKLASMFRISDNQKIDWPDDELCVELAKKFRESNKQFMDYTGINIDGHSYLM